MIIKIIGIISLLLGVVTFVGYINHPLSLHPGASYNGGRFWLVAFICALAVYFKG